MRIAVIGAGNVGRAVEEAWAIHAGPLKMARLLEPNGAPWINLAQKQGLGRNFAFGLLHPCP
jgi:predicted dinucleotide-binding enzyme